MGPSIEKWLKASERLLYEDLLKGRPLSFVESRQRKLAEAQGFMNRREAACAVRAAMEQARLAKLCVDPKAPNYASALADWLTSPSQIKKMEHAANDIDKRVQAKTKAWLQASTLAENRSLSYPIVFYMLSVHQKPADGHREYQGKLFYDRYFREALKGAGLEYYVPACEALIRNRGLRSVQDASAHDPWLVTRPYCRHRFVGVRTAEALTSSPKAILAKHPEMLDHAHRSLTDAQRWRVYRKRRQELNAAMKTAGKAVKTH